MSIVMRARSIGRSCVCPNRVGDADNGPAHWATLLLHRTSLRGFFASRVCGSALFYCCCERRAVVWDGRVGTAPTVSKLHTRRNR